MSDFEGMEDGSASDTENTGSSDDGGPDPSGSDQSGSEDKDEDADPGDIAESGSEGEDTVQALSREDKEAEIEKGKAVQHQLRVWDSLLEIRIRLQQLLIHSNRLPQSEQFQRIARTLMAEELAETDKAKLTASDLLDNLIALKEHMIENHPETSKTEKEKQTTKKEVDGDEEITSSEDEETMKTKKDEIVKDKKFRARLPKRRKLEEYEAGVQTRFVSLTPFRNQTIQKWNDRTQVASGKFNKKNFSAFQISTLKQIEQILNDRARLIKRTQLKRSHYEIIGKSEAKLGSDNAGGAPEDAASAAENEYDPEIFDDDDYYHQLLRELIERKTSNVTDPIQLSRHWLELQKFRSKMKRKVDTKASKARKIRYDIIPKLVNFMAPLDQTPMTDHAMNELFSSLFGQHK